MISVKAEGVDQLNRLLARLSREEIPTALRNATNDTARSVIKREEREIPRVFDNPTRLIQKPFWLQQKATKERPVAVVGIKDVYGKAGRAIGNALEPHIPGFSPRRGAKSMEYALRYRGLLGENQYLVPSRTMRLNRFGNITGATASKMLNDIGAFSGISGYTSTTKATKVKYVWGSVTTKNGKQITGIWIKSRWRTYQPAALAMLVVDGAPTYRKRFDFYGIAEDHIRRELPKHVALAVEFAIRRRT